MNKDLNTAIICLGGNTSDATLCMAGALDFILSLGVVKRSSGLYRTAPEYAGESEPYLNEVVELATSLPYKELQIRVKEYECGVRSRNKVCDLVNLDIDIVYWNDVVLRPKDSVAAYFLTGISKLDANGL